MSIISVQDFGPIRNAAIELKPLTVFMGPNNSGKSYLALAIYALSRTLVGEPSSRGLGGAWLREAEFSRGTINKVDRSLKRNWSTQNSIPTGITTIGDMPREVHQALESAMNSYGQELSSELATELQRCYGTDIADLSRKHPNRSSNGFQISLHDDESETIWDTKSTGNKIETQIWKTPLLSQAVNLRGHGLPISFFLNDAEFLLQMLMQDIHLQTVRNMMNTAYYMPASRSGILLGHKTLANFIVRRSSYAWVEPLDVPRLPGVVTDLIRSLLLLSPVDEPDKQLSRIVSYLEGEVSQGTVELESGVQYPEIYYETEASKYRIHQVSSMVSEIAPIVLFLKYLVRPGQIFIIEEPESHLDAENQRKVARAIAALIRVGVKVLITTHSDYFINQLNNLLLLSQVSPRKRASRKYLANEVLHPEDIGVYNFNPTSDGSVVQKINVSAESGIPTDRFADVHTFLYDEAIILERMADTESSK